MIFQAKLFRATSRKVNFTRFMYIFMCSANQYEIIVTSKQHNKFY